MLRAHAKFPCALKHVDVLKTIVQSAKTPLIIKQSVHGYEPGGRNGVFRKFFGVKPDHNRRFANTLIKSWACAIKALLRCNKRYSTGIAKKNQFNPLPRTLIC